MIAVQQDWNALRYASDELRKYRNIIYAVVQQNCPATFHSLLDNYKQFHEIINCHDLPTLMKCNGYIAIFYRLQHSDYIMTNQEIDEVNEFSAELYLKHPQFIMTDERMNKGLR